LDSPTVGEMEELLLNRLQDTLSDLTPSSFWDLDQVPGFPNDVYENNRAGYEEMESWYDGTVLDDTDKQSGKEVELYPVRINPIRGAVMKHAAVLFGDVIDDGRPLVIPRMVVKTEDKELAEEAEEALNILWYENHGRALQLRNGILSQYLGGCVFKLTYVPDETWRTIPIRIELVHPKSFVGIADASDYWRLRKGFVVRMISKELAKDYGVSVDKDEVWMVEEWGRGYYKVLIDGKLASRQFGTVRKDMGGTNPFNAVPMVYIPHTRTEGLYGESLIEGLTGIVKEINLRAGDYGDAVSDDAHAWLAMKNVHGTPKIVDRHLA